MSEADPAAAARQATRREDGSVGPLIEISVPATDELVEPLFELFSRHGAGAAIETRLRDATSGAPDAPETWVRTWVAADDADARSAIETGLWHLGRILPIPEATTRELAEANWAEAWKEHWTAQPVGSFLVAPTWLDVPEAEGASLDAAVSTAETTPDAPSPRHVLRLDPGTAFGTGQHPTTRLCLIAVEEALAAQPGARVLDVGTGSGILAIGAGLLGARELVGVDIDPRAAVTAAENAAANGVQLDARPGSIEAIQDPPFDLVVANILAHVIRELAPGLAALTRPGGRLIASGILDEQAQETAAALQAAGFGKPELRQDGDWVALIAERPIPAPMASGGPR
jgi:ribosomal protein L11 methyltransferase